MNRGVYIVLIFSLSAVLQGFGQGRGTLEVSNRKIAIDGDSLAISLRINTSRINISSDEQLQLRLYIRGGEENFELPYVGYSGKKRFLYEQRDAIVGVYQESYPAPYHIYPRVGKKEQYLLDYAVKIPYEQWMDTAMVVSRIYLSDCCKEKLLRDDSVIAYLNLNPKPKEELWIADSTVYRRMIRFMEPCPEPQKIRTETVKLYLKFQDKRSRIMPEMGNNQAELVKLDSLFRRLTSNELVDLNAVYITGYGIPEESFASGDRLVKERTHSVFRHVAAAYLKDKQMIMHCEWVAEDWAGIQEALEMEDETELLEVIKTTENLDRRKMKFKQNRASYRKLTKTTFPELARTSVSVHYSVAPVDDALAFEIAERHPDFLSHSELYRIAQKLELGSEASRHILEIAANHYPDDTVALNNISAIYLYNGDLERVRVALSRIADLPEAFNNLGVYYYIYGDMGKAREYFMKAADSGYEPAKANIKLLPDKKIRRIETHSASE